MDTEPESPGRRMRRIALLIVCFVALLCPAGAQYFGRNKIKYEEFDFARLHSQHFEIFFYPTEEPRAPEIARMAERWHARLSLFFEHEFESAQPIILYADRADFRQTNVLPGLISLGTRAVTEGMKNRVVLPLSGVLGETDFVLGHELVHAFQFDILKSDRELSFAAANRLPLWFVEGMAEYLSRGRSHPLTTMWLRDAVLRDALPALDASFQARRHSPYRLGHAVWGYVADRWGDDVVRRLFRSSSRQGWREAFRRELGLSPDSLSRAWAEDVRARHGAVGRDRVPPDSVGRPLLTGAGGYHLSPALSPDGRRIAFWSQRDIFTMDLYLADTRTGKVERKIASAVRDEHLDALRFADSGGAWSPDGGRLAIVASGHGDFLISILDLAGGSRETIALDSIPDIVHLAWSPDGGRLAFFGNAGGIGDLYLYDLEQGTVDRLTEDRFAELQPAWSPTGEQIAFMTERGSDTDLEQLDAGIMKIGLLDLYSGEIELIRLPDATHHLSPQFAPDGRSLYFIADPDGFNDLYRHDLASGQTQRITRVATGISGLTELSPALSVAADSGLIALNLFTGRGRAIHVLEPDRAGGETPIASAAPAARSGDGGPEPYPAGGEGLVHRQLRDETVGLPPDTSFARSPYPGRLELLRIGQVHVGVAADRYSTYLGGGIHLLWGDLLGNRRLAVAAQANGGLSDIGAQVTYQLLEGRINWGLSAAHIPYRSVRVGYRRDSTIVGGETVHGWRTSLLRERAFLERAAVIAEYPLSLNRRVEASLGYSHISYDVESEEVLIANGAVVESRTLSPTAASPLDLFHSSLAYVGDYSFTAFTSPVRGRRFRFEAEPTLGSLRYLSLTADYRHYLQWYPVTFAVRLLHQGRYLRDAESDRLSAYYLGYHTLVRGYDMNTVDAAEAGRDEAQDEANAVERLIGSRLGVMNLEVRLPVFGNDRYGLLNMPYVPLTAVAFLDGGVAWTRGDPPLWRLSDRDHGRIPVFSTGLALRANLLGAIVMQVYYARPFQRPGEQEQVGFVIAPGW